MGSATLVLVDGSYCLFRSYHGAPALENRKGEPTGAMLAVLRMLRRLLDTLRPEHFAVVFDSREPGFRHRLYPRYKANRPPMPADLARQIAPLHELVRAQALPLVIVPGVEADDVIATLATRAAAQGMQAVIVSADKDFAQLVDDQITLFHPGTWRRRDRAWVQKEFSVPAEAMVDFLTLAGDASDNIPGVRGVGPKTAARWLQKHGSLDALLARVDTLPVKWRAKLRASREQLPLFRTLVTVKTDVPLEDCSLAELKPGEPDHGQLRQLYERWDFRSLLAELDK